MINARIAQLVEHDLAKVGVAGSSPVSRSRNNISLYNRCPWRTLYRDMYVITSYQDGGTGRHARLKILWTFCPCGFESRSWYDIIDQYLLIYSLHYFLLVYASSRGYCAVRLYHYFLLTVWSYHYVSQVEEKRGDFDVPGAGIEPAQHRCYWFLRPTRLPIPPPRHKH